MIFTVILLTGLLHPLRIQSVRCVSPHACTITLNRNAGKDTPVSVTQKSGSSFTLTVRRGTKDVAFAFPDDIVYAGSSLGKN